MTVRPTRVRVDASFSLAIERLHGFVDALFLCGNVSVLVGSFGRQYFVNEVDDRLLCIEWHVRDGKWLPVVGIEVDVAATVRPQELVGTDGVHHPQQILDRKSTAVVLEFLTLRKNLTSGLISIARLFPDGSIAYSFKVTP